MLTRAVRLAAPLAASALLALASCRGEERREPPSPEALRFWNASPAREVVLPPGRCAAEGAPGASACRFLVYHVGYGDTVRLLWADYPDELSAWRAQLNSADTLSFSAGRARLSLVLPPDMVFPEEPFRELRLAWPEGDVDGRFLFSGCPAAEADFGSEGLQEGMLLGVPIPLDFACRTYRSGEELLCWSVGAAGDAEFDLWRGALPLEPREKGGWGMVRNGKGVRIVRKKGKIALVSGFLTPNGLDSLAEKLVSLQAMSP